MVSSSSKTSLHPPTPLIVPPSRSFDGNDGAWSTFAINVGSSGDSRSGQDFKVLVSIIGSVALVPLQANWCTYPNLTTCARDRGILPFNGKQSLGFKSNASSSY
jgi:hypothetical protein